MIIQRAKYKEKNIYCTKPVVKAKTNCKLQRWGCRQGAGLIGYFPCHWLSVETWGQTSCVSAVQGKVSRRLFTFLKHCVGHTQNIYGLDPTVDHRFVLSGLRRTGELNKNGIVYRLYKLFSFFSWSRFPDLFVL